MIKKIKKIFKILGPGLITGASDDDPSGIVTYSIAGAYNYKNFLWTPIFTLPLMYYIQEMCARIALVTGKGLIGIIKEKFNILLGLFLFLLVLISNSFNIYADLYITSYLLNKILPFIPIWIISLIFSLIITILILLLPYKKIANFLKVTTIFMCSYVFLVLFIKVNWLEIIKYSLIPKILFNYDYFIILLGILGTTISPYLFFWQAEEEIEELHVKEKEHNKAYLKKEIKYMREDTFIGMLFSNILMFFIILTNGFILNSLGIYEITKAENLIDVLKFGYGDLGFLFFTIAIISSTTLVIPVLAGGVAYSFCELFNIPASLDKSVKESLPFYFLFFLIILISNLYFIFKITPINALFYTAVIYGFITPILLFYFLKIANDEKIMKEYKNNFIQNLFVYIVLSLTLISSLVLLFSIFKK